MKIKRTTTSNMSLREFALEYDLTMRVIENSCDLSRKKFSARFEYSHIYDIAHLASQFGTGSTEEEAITDYAYKITNRVLIINCGGPNRTEIAVPNLINIW